MIEEMLRVEAASAMENCALSNRRLRIQISDINSCGERERINEQSTTLAFSNTMHASKPAHPVIRGSYAAGACSQCLVSPPRVPPSTRS
ncbi:hypothetical protein EVAR_31323_1 [Eumeta japonica]|uniref:Uncharacterized protein n=1 Tax=Eumeta variegata TaxID=151549 RepID=A0A4C1XYU1_EUMVA|nr:hypothetical protein EVAR_31323_1 [Eumeta japonica]